MRAKNFDIEPERGGAHLRLTLYGERNEAQVRAFLPEFVYSYREQPCRAVLVDLRQAIFPAPLSALVQRFSLVANLCPPSRVALLVGNVNAPEALLLAQAIRAARHDVVLTECEAEAEASLRPARLARRLVSA